MGRPRKQQASNGATLGFEAKLWQAADALRNNMDAAEYKHVVLGLIFLKYISDAFEEQARRARGRASRGRRPRRPRRVPRRQHLLGAEGGALVAPQGQRASSRRSAQLVDDAMTAIERDNPSLKGVLPKDYARPGARQAAARPAHQPGQRHRPRRRRPTAPRTSSAASTSTSSRSSPAPRARRAASSTRPRCVVRVLVEMLAPYKGRVYDPCCGSGGMFVQSEKFIEAHSGKIGDISIYGQESNYTTWRLAKMNLAIRGIDAQIAHGDTFHNDRHPDLKADYVLANPPFNDSDWRGELLQGRQALGLRRAARRQRQLRLGAALHPPPRADRASPASCSPTARCRPTSRARARSARRIIEADLVDCMVALPGQLFYSTQIPVCLWFLARDKKNGRFRDRRGETLFIDARKLGTLVDRVHRELTDDDIAQIAGTYHAWRGDKDAGEYADVPGFCKAATLDDIRKHGHVLTPGRYVGAEAAEDDGEPFEEKMKRLAATLREQQAEAAKLDAAIAANLKELGYGG